MAEKLIVPGHIADLRYVIPAIKTYADAGDWITTSDYIDREFKILKDTGVETYKKNDLTDYTKDAELPRYFGFVERKIKGNIQSECRISELGKKFYSAYKASDNDSIWESIMIALETITFGRNNDGCPNSDSNLEVPNILLISALLLDGITRQEFASILYRMLNGYPLSNAITHIKICRLNGSDIGATIRVDNKIIPFLVNVGFLSDDNRKINISKPVLVKYSERISKLKPTNNDVYIFTDNYCTNIKNNENSIGPLQQIYYGAPGTGKSHRIKEIIHEKGINEKEQVFRTTFHPDSDYSTFVGCYKPIMKSLPQTYVVEGKEKPVINIATGKQSEKEEIVYDYTPQAFIQAYTKAWTNPDKPVILVIEEINRGNCAQIFGDIFQLLDRGDDNFSDYEIKPDKALEDYLKGYFAKINDIDIPERIKSGEIMKLSSNLYIWATMNTSDQSLFPIDSAFKRRWDWVYMPIDTKKEVWHIKVGGVLYSWTAFLEKINNEILTDETAEDKHLGFYFCKAENNEITQETFVGKVLFYLWNDVFKVYGIPSLIGSSKEWAYTKFYNTDGKVNEQKVMDLMAKLQIIPEGINENAAEEVSEQ